MIAPPGTTVLNPVFDVTPAELITAIVTEEGVLAAAVRAGAREARGSTRAGPWPATRPDRPARRRAPAADR